MQVGYLGVGNMGQPMAGKLMDGGHSLVVFDVSEAATGGGSDANAFNAAGFEAVLLANGTTANHTPEESVAARKLDQMLDVAEALVASC